MMPVPGSIATSSRPLVAMTVPVATGARDMYLEPGRVGLPMVEPPVGTGAGPPKTTYLPSGVSARSAPNFDVSSAGAEPPSAEMAATSTEAQGRV
jgi:hypothetical protein